MLFEVVQRPIEMAVVRTRAGHDRYGPLHAVVAPNPLHASTISALGLYSGTARNTAASNRVRDRSRQASCSCRNISSSSAELPPGPVTLLRQEPSSGEA